jgi:hypothetical protein
VLIRDPDEDLWARSGRWILRFYAGGIHHARTFRGCVRRPPHAILRIAVKTLAGVVRSERGRDGCFRLQLLASLAARESHFLALGAQGTIAKVGATSVLTDQAGRCNR